MQKFKLPENLKYRNVETGEVDNDGNKVTVKVRMNRRQCNRMRSAFNKRIREQSIINDRKTFMTNNNIITKNQILDAIQNLHDSVTGQGITETASKFVKKRGLDIITDYDDDCEFYIKVDLTPITAPLKDYQIVDENGENMTEKAREEINNEVEEIMKERESFEQMMKYDREIDGDVCKYVEYIKDTKSVKYTRNAQEFMMSLNDWIALPLVKPDGADEVLGNVQTNVQPETEEKPKRTRRKRATKETTDSEEQKKPKRTQKTKISDE